MKRYDVVSIFPDMITDWAKQSLVARAIAKRLIAVKSHDLRAWTKDRHKSVDGKPYGGGAGMVLMVEPIAKAVASLQLSANRRKPKTENRKLKTRIILLSAKGKQFTQRDAKRLQRYDQVVFICGRYEGVDERVAKHIADEELSVGPYVLFGGEVPAMTIMESMARLVPGVIKMESLEEESHWSQLLKKEGEDEKELEYPHYTRPEEIAIDGKKRRVPKVLLGGNHAEIRAWRDKQRKSAK